MITISILWIILFISLVLIVSGVFFKNKALILVFFGGVILIITGVLTLVDPISYTTVNNLQVYGTNFTAEHLDNDTASITNITQPFLFHEKEVLDVTPINTQLNFLLSLVMILLGLASMIGSANKLHNQKFEEEPEEKMEL